MSWGGPVNCSSWVEYYAEVAEGPVGTSANWAGEEPQYYLEPMCVLDDVFSISLPNGERPVNLDAARCAALGGIRVREASETTTSSALTVHLTN